MTDEATPDDLRRRIDILLAEADVDAKRITRYQQERDEARGKLETAHNALVTAQGETAAARGMAEQAVELLRALNREYGEGLQPAHRDALTAFLTRARMARGDAPD